MKIALLLSLLALPLAAQPLPLTTPGEAGLSPERLDRLHACFEHKVRDGKRAGAITLIARDGRIIDWRAYGHRDLDARLPMEKDTICRVWSMSKMVTTVAVLQLLEEGRFQLGDPVQDYIPEMRNLKVFAGGTAEKPEVADLKSPVTIKNLLTHTCGMTYAGFGDTPVHELYGRAHLFDASSLEEFVQRAVRIPLLRQPDEVFSYGISMDVAGYLVERVSGMPLQQYVKKRILDPLRMADTSFDFEVPREKRARLARLYRTGAGGLLELAPEDKGNQFPSGGGGLCSTTGDFARFGQMLLNGGELDGARVLGKKTVELMMVNHLNGLARQTLPWSDSDGFGLGGQVRIDVAKGNRPGSVGEYGWTGGSSTYFRIDAKERTIALMYMQYLPMDTRAFDEFSTLFYQALVQ
jgi:CubicO group peptidase (beta-lactamase class C family)